MLLGSRWNTLGPVNVTPCAASRSQGEADREHCEAGLLTDEGCVHAVLPVNLASHKKLKASAAPSQALTSTFTRLTISNLEKGSQDYWCAFYHTLGLPNMPTFSAVLSLCMHALITACPAQVRLWLPNRLDGVCVLAPRQVLPGNSYGCGWDEGKIPFILQYHASHCCMH